MKQPSQGKSLFFVLCSLTLLAVPMPAMAEVMDKEFSPVQIWLWCLLGALIGFWLCRFRAWLILGVLPLVLLLPLAVFGELRDPYVGPAIIKEAGYSYVVQFYVASFFAVAGPLAGAGFRLYQRSQGLR